MTVDLAERRLVVFMTWDVWRALPRDEWRTWLRRHGLDPARIPMGASIAVNEPDHTIRVSHYFGPRDGPNFGFADPITVQCESTVMEWPAIGGQDPGLDWESVFKPAPATLG